MATVRRSVVFPEHKEKQGSPKDLGAGAADVWSCLSGLSDQGRSSVVEQRPFKPKVVGSIPTAPTKPMLFSTTCNQTF